MVPIVLTSVRNCFSPWLTLSSLFTAITVESGKTPLKTEPNPPPPNLSEKFLVAFCKSLYPNATKEPSTTPLALPDSRPHFLHIIKTATRIAITAIEPKAAPITTPFLFLPPPKTEEEPERLVANSIIRRSKSNNYSHRTRKRYKSNYSSKTIHTLPNSQQSTLANYRATAYTVQIHLPHTSTRIIVQIPIALRSTREPRQAIAERFRVLVASTERPAISVHHALLSRLRPEQIPIGINVIPRQLLDLPGNIHDESRHDRRIVERIREVALVGGVDVGEVVDVIQCHFGDFTENMTVPGTTCPILLTSIPSYDVLTPDWIELEGEKARGRIVQIFP
ncbi:hypothetical protein MIMGU_mgv1a009652mg [Erythranthe guttata]|uniref:Uncharacterized protein n=1 Tax=Erythranthe guttata TaxID=4155 RepID=A0A022QE77_ERYGU|nr:hypothetical protein MIMGU_mgv1a009652mg [Erythranthe guttata]